MELTTIILLIVGIIIYIGMCAFLHYELEEAPAWLVLLSLPIYIITFIFFLPLVLKEKKQINTTDIKKTLQ